MRISIIGSGYVGLVTAVGFAMRGHSTICVDIDKEKVEKINFGIPPIFEPGLEEKLKEVLKKSLLKATSDINYAIKNSDLTFIAVGTPSNPDGSIDLKFIRSAAKGIGSALEHKEDYHTICVKSTVVPETTEKIVIPLIEKYSGKKAGVDFGACMNPEFLREGNALEDFLHPDRIVIGELDKKSGDMLAEIYKDFKAPVLRTNLKTAELIKYASNAMLAARISLTNEIGNIAKRLGIDVYDVMAGVGLDKRIGKKFLNAGCGFGGSCFPKDVKALVAKAKELDYEPHLLTEVLSLNDRQKVRLVEMVEQKFSSLKGKRIAILGLAFKPGTDDVRESPAIDLVAKLLEKGAIPVVYDPKAADNFKKVFPDLNYASSARKALKEADACLILTAWDEFKSLSDKDFDRMRSKIILEGRKVLDRKKVKKFEGICW
jgi:UDPglucose 6-dehydrogenase